MDLSNKLKMLFLQFNFDMIYKIHKMLALLKNNLDSNNDSIFECFLKSMDQTQYIHNRVLFLFLKTNFFSKNIMEILHFEGENIIKETRNLFRLKQKN